MGMSSPSLLIESTDSMILYYSIIHIQLTHRTRGDILACIPSIHETAFFSISLAGREQSSEIGSIADPLIEDESWFHSLV